jgi:hypothetical protein
MKLIKKTAIVLIILVVFAIIAMFSPYFYAIVPVHESDICMCNFYVNKKSSSFGKALLQISTETGFYVMQLINIISYYLVNYLFLVGLIYMNFMIRHIKENLSLVKEIT